MSKGNILAAILTACLSLGSAGTSASAADGKTSWPAPAYEDGDTFIFDNGRVETYRGAGEKGLVWARRSGREFVRDRSFFVPMVEWDSSRSRGTGEVRGDPAEMWPIHKGSSARFSITRDSERREDGETWEDADGRRSSQHWRCKASKLRAVEVPAGEFDAYPIECKRYSKNSMRVTRKTTFYYSPDVGHYIRMKTVSYMSGERNDFSLIAALPGDRANRKRIRAILKDWRSKAD